jgi:DNA-binding response OmpR family regulator
MGTRKTTFEVVSLAAIAPLIGDAQILGEPEGTGAKTTARRILSVTYDPSLATTREMLFSSIGLHVTSALTLEDAIGLCQNKSFDLIVVGHSIPIDRRQLMVKGLRRCCDAPILALYRPVEPSLPGADYTFDSTQSPVALLAAITNILKSKTGPSLENASIS